MTREMNTVNNQSARAANNIGTNLSKALGNQPIVKAANSAFNSAVNVAANVGNGAINAANVAVNGATNAMNSIFPTAPLNSSLTRMGNNINKLNNSIQNGFDSVGETVRNNVNKAVNNTANTFNLGGNNGGNSRNANMNLLFGNGGANGNAGANVAAETGSSLWAMIGIFLTLVLTFVLLFVYFASEIKDGYDKLGHAIRSSLGLEKEPPAAPMETVPDALVPPPSEPVVSTEQTQNLLERVLPLGRNAEVFNVSKNEFTYYDAEPLCRALGAELASYEQVKDAYEKGADWCNYGWVKGQVAVYPTQKATWDQLQNGPDDQQEACGRPGVNGGFFDNPEMRFGVNCYGPKPAQSAHDEAELMKQGRIPRTTDSLKVEEKINEYKRMADSLGVMPFNKGKWGTL